MKPERPNIPYLDAFRAELLAGIAHTRRRRTLRRRFALAVGAVAVAIPLGLAGPPGGVTDGGTPTVLVSRALAITTEDGWIELRVVDPTADPERMTEELRDSGINGQVCTVLAPTPAAEGAWLAIAETRTAGGVGVAAELKIFPEQALSPDERTSPPRAGERVPPIEAEITATALEPVAGAAKAERETADGVISIRGRGRLREVRRTAPDLIRIRADFAGRPQPGALRLFLGRAPEPDERVPADIRGSTECA